MKLIKLVTISIVLCLSFDKLLMSKHKVDFASAVKVYCLGKSTNFCSKENLKIMHEIEKKRQREIEMAKQMKRMQSEVIRNILKMTDKLN